MATNALQSKQFTFGVKMLGGQKLILYHIPRCNQSFFSGMDSSSLHCAFRSLLTDRTNL